MHEKSRTDHREASRIRLPAIHAEHVRHREGHLLSIRASAIRPGHGDAVEWS